MTGRNLDADLRDPGKYDLIGKALSGTWPTASKAMSAYPTLLSNYSEAGTRVTDNAPGLNTSLAGAGDSLRPSFGAPTAAGNGYATALRSPPQAAPAATGEGSSGPVPLADTPANRRDYQVWRYENGGTNKNATYDQYRAMLGNPGMGAVGSSSPPAQPASAPVGFASLPTAPQPIRLAQNGPTPAFGSLGGPQLFGPQMPAPQASLPQGAPAGAPQMPQMVPGGFAPVMIAGKTPEQWARLGAYGEAIGMPNIAAPMLQAGQMNPNFKYQQELAAALAKLQTAGPQAAAEGWGKAGPELYVKNNEPYTLRPGAIRGGPNGPIASAPVQVDAVDPATGRTYKTWAYPPMPGAQPTGAQPTMPGAQLPAVPGFGAQMAGPGGELTKLGPGEETERKSIGETLGEEYKGAVTAYGNAQKSLPALDALGGAFQNFRTGPFAGDRLQLGRAWQDFLGTVGVNPSSDLAKWVASGEIIGKEGTRLGYELARTLGSREAQMIVQQAIASNPGLANSPQGNQQLLGLIRQGLQRDIDRRGFYDGWLQNGHTSIAGAATAFDQARPANLYISQVLPIKVTSKTQYDQLANGTRYLDPNGNPRTKGYTGAQ